MSSAIKDTTVGVEVASVRSTDEVTVTVSEYGCAPAGTKLAGMERTGEVAEASVPKFGQLKAAKQDGRRE